MRSTGCRTGAVAVGLAVAVLGGATGCTWLPDVSMSPGISGHEDRENEEGREATDAAEAAEAQASGDDATIGAAATPAARPAGDLDTGSITHTLPAGTMTVVIDYWTAQQATTWTPTDPKTVELAAHVEDGDDATTVLVTRFAATADDGTTRIVAAEDRGEFALMPPFSYTTAFSLPESAPDASAMTLYVQFDLLVETEPGSQRYFRQTVLDSLELPLLEEASP